MAGWKVAEGEWRDVIHGFMANNMSSGLSILRRYSSRLRYCPSQEQVVLFSLLSVERYNGFPLTGSARLVLDFPDPPKIPVLGWLSKNRQIREEKSELLISLSPTIIKGYHHTQP